MNKRPQRSDNCIDPATEVHSLATAQSKRDRPNQEFKDNSSIESGDEFDFDCIREQCAGIMHPSVPTDTCMGRPMEFAKTYRTADIMIDMSPRSLKTINGILEFPTTAMRGSSVQRASP